MRQKRPFETIPSQETDGDEKQRMMIGKISKDPLPSP
jgi:hypothetical protein